MRDPPEASRRGEIARDEDSYPPLLRSISRPPERLYVRGDPAILSARSVALVGARKATGLGLAMAEGLGAGLAAAGVAVVSGCAIGIDAAGHRGALRLGGATVAVLAGGLDVAVPPSNRGLAERIVRSGGCLAGEFPDGVPVSRWSFPRRNRIIAGLARVTVVVEAAGRSGALITARLALEAGREVLAVPGHPLQPEHAGSNALLADGARPVLRVEDVLEELGTLPPLEGAAAAGSHPRAGAALGTAARVRSALSFAPRGGEAIAIELGLPLRDVLVALTELELLGCAVACPGARFALPQPPSRTSRTSRERVDGAGPSD